MMIETKFSPGDIVCPIDKAEDGMVLCYKIKYVNTSTSKAGTMIKYSVFPNEELSPPEFSQKQLITLEEARKAAHETLAVRAKNAISGHSDRILY